MVKEKHWEAFLKLINASDEVTAGKPRSELALGLMFEALKAYHYEDVSRAVAMHIREEKFAVTPSDIIRRIEGSPEEHRALAWSNVMKAMNMTGHSFSVRFPHPAYHYAIQEMGGWMYLCESTTYENMKWREKEFKQFFETGERVASWSEHPGKKQVSPYLMGYHEANNRKCGYLDRIPPIYDALSGKAMPDLLPALTSGNDKSKPVITMLVGGMKA